MSKIELSANEKTESLVGSEVWVAIVGRIFIAAIFLLSGLNKILDPASAAAYISTSGFPLVDLAFATAVLVEISGGIALVIGYRIKLVAAVLAIFSLTAALMFHANLGDQNQFIHFFKNVALCGGLMQIVVFGTGRSTSVE